jgi:hypothetical protein
MSHLVMLVAKQEQILDPIVFAVLVDVVNLEIRVLSTASDGASVAGFDLYSAPQFG